MAHFESIDRARDALTVRRVYGDPIQQGDLVIIPAAKVAGGGGAGGDALGNGGGGFGLRAVPAGAFVVKGGVVRWEPAFDLNRALLVGQLVAIVLLLVIRSIAASRRPG